MWITDFFIVYFIHYQIVLKRTLLLKADNTYVNKSDTYNYL